MRRAKSRTISALVLISLLISLGFVLAYPASGEESCRGKTAPHRYTVFFRTNSSDGLWGGRFQAHNDAVLTRILDLRRLWPDIDAVRFMFVARRSQTCGPETNCNSHRLLFERVRAISRKMAELAERAGRPAPTLPIDIAFANEVGQRLSTSFLPAGADGVVLRIKLERSEIPSGECFGRIRVWDPALPRTIGAQPERPVLPVPAGEPVQLGQCAKLRLDSRWRDAVMAFWGNGSGAYRQAEPELLSGHVVPVPDDRQALYLLSRLRLSAPAWRRFYSQLSPSFRRPESVPPPLRSRKGRDRSKGLGDHGEFLPDGGVTRPRPSPEGYTGLCRFTFAPQNTR